LAKVSLLTFSLQDKSVPYECGGGPKISQRSQGQPQPLNREYMECWSLSAEQISPPLIVRSGSQSWQSSFSYGVQQQTNYSNYGSLRVTAWAFKLLIIYLPVVSEANISKLVPRWTVTHNIGSQALVKLTVFFIPGFSSILAGIRSKQTGRTVTYECKEHYKGNKTNKEFYKGKS